MSSTLRGREPRVLMCSSYLFPQGYGAETQALSLAGELARQGTKVSIVTRRIEGLPRGESLGGVPVDRSIRIARRARMVIPAYIVSLGGYLLRHRHGHELVHVHQADLDAWVAVRLRSLTGKRVIVKVAACGPYGEIARLKTPRHRGRLFDLLGVLAGVRRADLFIATSGGVRAELLENGFDPAKIVTIPNGIPEDRLAEARPFSDRPGAGGRTLLFVGRLEEQKGLEHLIMALAALKESYPALRAVLVGDGTRRAALERMAGAAGLGERIIFAGQAQDVRPHLASADLFVLPSLAEGMSNALLEAMAAGLPCLATKVAGSEELIHDGRNGRLVGAGDPRDLAAALGAMLGDPEGSVRMGLEARRAIRETYAMSAIAGRYRALYRDLVG